MKTLYVLVGSLVLVLVLQTYARADDHMIRPQCWEENDHGVVKRHCAVAGAGQPAPQASPQAPQPPQAAAPPLPYGPAPYAPQADTAGPPYGPPPGYQSTLPPRYWPGAPQQGANYANPCTPYICGYGSPYGYPPPYYYGPGFAFRFGPFQFWIP